MAEWNLQREQEHGPSTPTELLTVWSVHTCHKANAPLTMLAKQANWTVKCAVKQSYDKQQVRNRPQHFHDLCLMPMCHRRDSSSSFALAEESCRMCLARDRTFRSRGGAGPRETQE
ncbi:hypothetical protein RvY_15385 [Ramazzottius varieornatus]|uniref:Uncharacterized protein n=1 Tax=Ramazzottius varieornatus TaxID=947166 RepID=A0A1D1VZF6_RAMVA|nr:hypothetical protein RvY_15385 [Ramazzottius varieornatus]